MGFLDKAKSKVQQARGKGTESVGRATGDDKMRRKGQKDQVAGNAKEVGGGLKDKFLGGRRRGSGESGVGDKAVDASEKAKRKFRR